MKRFASLATAAALVLLPSLAAAQNILIVNGSSGTSEPGTTSLITSNLKTLHEAVGNIVTVVSDIPADFSGFAQIWDIRFDEDFALTAGQQTSYLGYLQGGGRMFLMGENSGFAARNNSIFSFIAAAGGGTVGFNNSCAFTQTVQAPFNGPNVVSSVGYNSPGCFDGTGTGQWITNGSPTSGAGVAWTTGTLANASAGVLTSILDLNFMQHVFPAQLNLTENLISFVNNPPPAPNVVPEPSTYVLIATGFAGLLALRRRRTSSKI